MTELQLEFIREFGRKELTEGCYVKYRFSYNPDIEGEEELGRIQTYDGRRWAMLFEGYNIDDFSTIGHPVQWHDVFARLKENGFELYLHPKGLDILPKEDEIKIIPCNPRESPMEQPELIEQLLLLIK